MVIEILGSGTSGGIPVIGCGCAVCRSADPRDTRRRPSLLVRDRECDTAIVVDCGPDFRAQALSAGIDRISALLITHQHADHIHGIDDLRPIATHDRVVALYAEPPVVADLKTRFNYVFTDKKWPNSSANVDARLLTVGSPVMVDAVEVTPLRVYHGAMPVTAFLFAHRGRRVAYLTDCSRVPAETANQIRGVDVLIIDALRDAPHPTHFSISESITFAAAVNAPRALFTHFCHEVSHGDLLRRLPPHIRPAFDGQRIVLD